DGLCSTVCPVGIDTGAFIKELRGREHSPLGNICATLAAGHFHTSLSLARAALSAAHILHRAVGTQKMLWATKQLRKLGGHVVPQWNPFVPKPSSLNKGAYQNESRDTVVYFPCCVSRLFGSARNGPYSDSQNVRIARLLSKSGYNICYPKQLQNLCCGLPFSSKGFLRQGDRKGSELKNALQESSNGGTHPILFDTSPCTERLRTLTQEKETFEMYDISDFLLKFVIPRLNIHKRAAKVAVHIPCSLRRGDRQASLIKLANLCADSVVLPE